MKLSKEQLKELIKEVSGEQVATGAYRAGGIIELVNNFRGFVAAAMMQSALSKGALTKLILGKLTRMAIGGPFALLLATYELTSLAAWLADYLHAGSSLGSDRRIDPGGGTMTMDQRTAMFRKDAGLSHRVDHLPIQESMHWTNNNYGGELMKITKSQLKQIIKEELESVVQEGRDPKYVSLLRGCMGLLQSWQPKTPEGTLYKKQLDDLLTKVEGV